ncbi:hypothetical protein COLO4_16385 [Corchorus olitorius]|uniref:PB1-like domain-containing protein n=1 Tax=Corchorus olitorius TaxID=93759 RepID=A0A1R3JHU3_9ROSI|nr:hypothetical protein COLO4_16385 [Corchorus olitorius]
MFFETAIIRFHYQGSLVGTGEDLIYEGGFVDELQFDPDRIGYYDFISICERVEYQNVHKMWYNRPGFKLVDGSKKIRDDASILDMIGEMYVNDGVIDVFIEHFVHEPEGIVGLIENGPLEDGENGPLQPDEVLNNIGNHEQVEDSNVGEGVPNENLQNGDNGENLVDVNVNENLEAVNVDHDQQVEVEQVHIDVGNLQQGDDHGFEDYWGLDNNDYLEEEEEKENEAAGVGPSALGSSNAGPSNASQPIGGEDYRRKKAGRTSSSTNVSANINLGPSPQVSADMASNASSTPTGNAEASGSVEVPRKETKKKTRFTVVDSIGNMHNVSGERSSPVSQAKYADRPPVTTTSLQRNAHKKFKARMEALKIREQTQGEVSGLKPNNTTSSKTNHSTQEGLGSSGSSKGKQKI